MRATERMTLVNKIGSELQGRFTFAELDRFLAAVGVSTKGIVHGNSKRIYAVDVLQSEPEAKIIELAAELDMPVTGTAIQHVEPPENWKGKKRFRLFISHISKDKIVATRLKEELYKLDILGFVAHEDIQPTLAWQDQIERGLQTMDAMVAVHTAGFSASYWTQQEIGFALGRNVKIISFKYDEDPTGFIGKHQALSKQRRNAEQIATEIDRLLAADPRTATRLKEGKDAWEVDD